MRIAAAILGILGGLASALLGAKWLLDAAALRSLTELAHSVGANTSEIDRLVRAAYFLVANLPIAIIAAVLALRGKGKVAAGMLVIGAALPAVFDARTIVFTALMGVAGLLAFFSKPKQANATNARAPGYPAAA